MNLRQKLLTTFAGLALLTLATAGMTMWTIAQWQNSNQKLRGHYQRSLLLQRVRATTFRAFKEVPDAVTGGDTNARLEFEQLLKPAEQDFKVWSQLADSKAERQQVQQVRSAYESLIQAAQKVFALVEANRRNEAIELMEGQLEDRDLLLFQKLTEQAATSDRQNRQVINTQVENTRQTAQIALTIAAFGVISLVLLLAAYLAADLFAPLREVKQAMDDVAKGDLQRRLEMERADEIGAVGKAFNRMLEAIQERHQVEVVSDGVVKDGNFGWQSTPSRVTLHRLVSQLRSACSSASLSRFDLVSQNDRLDSDRFNDEKQTLIEQLDVLLQAVTRITDFGFPLDLHLARTDIRALLYEILSQFQIEFARRGISFELNIASEVNYAVVDRLKLREVLSELVRNSLAALPEQGGRLGIRTLVMTDSKDLLIEVADNGSGLKQSLIESAFRNINIEQEQSGVGLTLTKAIVEQHGGQLKIDSEPGKGTNVQIHLPSRA